MMMNYEKNGWWWDRQSDSCTIGTSWEWLSPCCRWNGGSQSFSAGFGFWVGPIIVEHKAVILHRLAKLYKSVLQSHPSAIRPSEFFHENFEKDVLCNIKSTHIFCACI